MAARKPSDRRHGGDEEIPDLNLVPIMAIMVILIPMLIYMFTFHQIRVQRVMAPRRGTGAKKANEEKKEKELNLTIVIKRNQGFALTWEQALMDGTQTSDLIKMRTFQGEQEAYCGDPSDPDAERHQGCEFVNGVCQCYDFPALYNSLVQKKLKFSKPEKPEKRVNITTDDMKGVTWEVLSRTMDAATCRLQEDSYSTMDSYYVAKPKLAKKLQKVPGVDDPVQLCEPLFPNVVFAMAE